jgi:hypothetical protein
MIAALYIIGIALVVFSFFTGFFFIFVFGAGLVLVLASLILSFRSPRGLSGELGPHKKWFRCIAIAWAVIFGALVAVHGDGDNVPEARYTARGASSQFQGRIISNSAHYGRGTESFCWENLRAPYLLLLNDPVPEVVPTYLHELWSRAERPAEVSHGTHFLPLFVKRTIFNGWGLFQKDLTEYGTAILSVKGELTTTGVVSRPSSNYECKWIVAESVGPVEEYNK